MLKNTIITALIWLVCLLKLYLHADYYYPFKTVIDIVLVLIAGMVSFFAIKKAFAVFNVKCSYKYLSPVFAAGLGFAALLFFWLYLTNRDRANSLLYAIRNDSNFESTLIDLRTDGTYKISKDYFLKRKDLRGTYSISDSLITLDEAYPSYKIPGRKLVLRPAKNAVGEENKNLIHQIIGDKAASQQQRYELVVISPDGTRLINELTFKMIDKP